MSDYVVKNECQITDLDLIYKKHLGYKTDGYFVEIGAYDGETYSNTCFLADLGWKGIYAEPIPEYADMCLLRHKDNEVEVYKCAVGDICKDDVLIHIAGQLSTTLYGSEAIYKQAGLEKLYETENKHKAIYVRQYSLNCLLKTAKLPTHFDLLVLDTEGNEWDILKNFDIDKWRPKMAIIEMHETSAEWNSMSAVAESNASINEYFTKHGYESIHKDAINTIFFDKGI